MYVVAQQSHKKVLKLLAQFQAYVCVFVYEYISDMWWDDETEWGYVYIDNWINKTVNQTKLPVLVHRKEI